MIQKSSFRIFIMFSVILLMSGCGKKSSSTPSATVNRIVVECEDAKLSRPFAHAVDAEASGKVLILGEVGKKELAQAEPIAVAFDCKVADDYQIWLRAWWKDGCGNSISLGLDDAKPRRVGNDGTYQSWHWVRCYTASLSAGPHTLSLKPSEPNIKVDQVLLTTNREAFPEGILNRRPAITPTPKPPASVPTEPARLPKEETPEVVSAPKQKPVKIEVPKPVPQEVIAKPKPPKPHKPPEREPGLNPPPALQAAPHEPFRVGIGGAYRGGPESFMCQLGVPYTRLEQNEISDYHVLKNYDLVYISGGYCGMSTRELFQALHKYVKSGGTLLIEKFEHAHNTEESVALIGKLKRGNRRPFKVESDNSEFLEGLPKSMPVHSDIGAPVLKHLGSNTKTYGKIKWRGRAVGPALVHKTVGDGQVWVLVASAGFSNMWRNQSLDPLGLRVVKRAIGDRYRPAFDAMARPAVERPRVLFADDFMRKRAELGAWRLKSGNAKPTGKNHGFALRLEGESTVQADSRLRPGYCLAASIKAEKGQGGLWFSSGAKTIRAAVDTRGGRLRFAGKEQPLPVAADDWLRLSVFQREGVWQVWLNGEAALRLDDELAVDGSFGVFSASGAVLIDDVRVCRVSDLLTGQDRMLGEPGSPIANSPTDKGLEPRTIFNNSWHFEPDSSGRRALQLNLPTFQEATLIRAGKGLALITASAERQLIPIPGGKDTCYVLCPGWRDYNFGAQVTDWYGTGSAWKQQPRWSCSPAWTWFGSAAFGKTAVLWYRKPLKPPYAAVVYVAPSAEQHRRRENGRDLNLVIAGNGKDLEDGLLLKVGPYGKRGCELLRNGKRLAQERKLGLPYGHALHHRWFELMVIVENNRIRFFYEGHPIFDQKLDTALPAGQFGFWTHDNSVRIAKATLSVSE